MEIIGSFILCLIAALSTLLGYLFTYIKVKNIDRFICISLSLSFGVMTLISLKELLPESINYLANKISIIYLIIIPIIIFILIKILDLKKETNSLYRVGVLSMIVLILHNIPEGIITLMSTYINFKIGIKLTIAILVHNIVEGIAIAVPIYYSTSSRKRSFLYTLLTSISEVFGALLLYLLFKDYFNVLIINIILYIIGCLMLIISLTKILKEILSYKNIYYFLYGLLLSLFILIL